jgi:hypothetical protein
MWGASLRIEAARFARKVAVGDEPIDQTIGGRFRQLERGDDVKHVHRPARGGDVIENGEGARGGAELLRAALDAGVSGSRTAGRQGCDLS